MQSILTGSEVPGRASASLLLGNDNGAAVLDALKDALSDKDWSVRAAAVHSLALKKELEPLLRDYKEAVRIAGRCGIPAVVRDSGRARDSETHGYRVPSTRRETAEVVSRMM